MMRGVLSRKIADSYGMRDGFSNAVAVGNFSFHQKGDNPSYFEVMHWRGFSTFEACQESAIFAVLR